LKQYFWAAGFLTIAVAFTPVPVAVKVFVLMGITCIATLSNLFSAFRPHPSPVV
jgi:hypothetical protein